MKARPTVVDFEGSINKRSQKANLDDGVVKLKQESIKLGEVITHIGAIPIVIPLKLFYISWEIRYSHEGSLIANYMYMSPFVQKLTGERIPTQHW